MSNLYDIFPPTYVGVIYKGSVVEYELKMYNHAEISRYEVFSLFIVNKYTRVSKNIIWDYTWVTQSMICVHYRYKGKMIIINTIIITKTNYAISHEIIITWVTIIVLLDNVQCL